MKRGERTGGPEEYLEEAYAAAGWAAIFEAPPEKGTVFEWRGEEWEVVEHFPFPCHPSRACSLVRLHGGDLRTWQGLACPECHATYTVEGPA